MTIGRAAVSVLALGVAAAATLAPAAAQDFYKGKTVTIVVGFTAGGGLEYGFAPAWSGWLSLIGFAAIAYVLIRIPSTAE